MEAGNEHDNIVNADFSAHRREIAIQNSPFGPIQKYGEAILKNAQTEEETPAIVSKEPFSSTRDSYMRWDVSRQASALERTDLSDPKQPFFDF